MAEAYALRPDSPTYSQDRPALYVACYVAKLENEPQRLCDPATRQRLIRHMRGYFALLQERKEIAQSPVAGEFVKIERRLNSRTGIDTGPDDFAPDPGILTALAALVREGVLPQPDFTEALKPDVPQAVIDALGATRPVRPYCS